MILIFCAFIKRQNYFLMKKYILFVLLFALSGISAIAQSHVDFYSKPPMVLNKQAEYSGYKVKYSTSSKSTIYLELKNQNNIIASGAIEVNKAQNKVKTITLKSKRADLPVKPNTSYSYNLYMYKGGRNDYTRKSCRSIKIDGVTIKKNTKSKKSNNIMSFKNFFN